MWWCITTTFPSAGCSESRLVPDCILYGPQQVPMCCVVLVQLFSARIVCVADICVCLSVGVFFVSLLCIMCLCVQYVCVCAHVCGLSTCVRVDVGMCVVYRVRVSCMCVRTCVWIVDVRAC